MFCRHPRLTTLPTDLFSDLGSFRELESRIALLDEELQRGDALEVFVEAYLQTHPLFQVKDLWLVGQIPGDVRKTLNLPRDQKGIDGVFRTRSGSLVPYQVKFRIARPQVTVREVSTFLGLTERAEDRMLISNSDRYAGDIENRDCLRILTGTYFDSLTRDELAAIAEWLKGRPARPTPATPRPHQQAAIKDITVAFATEDRATAVMACGTGKTLVGLRVAEAMEAQTVLVLVPSLALLSQALADWSRDTTWGERFEYLCVCSDPSVSEAADQWTLRTTETPFPVQTQPKVVRDFVSRPAKGRVRVVFSTYQSAPIVAKGMPRGGAFDFAIFDEAHKTAGPHQGTFAFALDNRRLRVRKRLFLTATPRRIDIRHKDRQGDFRVVSMEDTTVYGRRAHELSFAEAVSQGIICDYRVVVATVDPKEIPAAAIKHGVTLVRGDQHATRWVAMQIAVAKAIKETGARKIITFHSRVEQAKHFASDTPKGIQNYLPSFSVGHVSGADAVAVRKEVLAGFREERKQLVANARCLTEGVDLPAVDMVVFSNPRKSKVDIIQAIGRAMRKPRGGDKVVGYVVVPVLLAPDKANDLESACRNTDWEDIVDVLAALRDHDCRLEEIIRTQQVALGEGRAFNPRDFAEQVQVIGARVSVNALQQHLSAVVLERLGVGWDLRFGELQAFKGKEGHCNVPKIYPQSPALGHWLDGQRQLKRRGALSAERLQRLDALGVTWDPFAAFWDEQAAALVEFKTRTGHCHVPQACSEFPQLARWLSNQRSLKKRGLLPATRERQLESIGVVWNRREAVWLQRLAELQEFAVREGHANVPETYPPAPALGVWLAVQRQAKDIGRLSLQRTKVLESVGVVWDVRDHRWEQQYAALESYKRTHGHCDVPQNEHRQRDLARWLHRQLSAKRLGTLSPDRVKRLSTLGVSWEPRGSRWESHFAALKVFQQLNGHCDVPQAYSPKPSLNAWVEKQRCARRAGRLSRERASRLQRLGFDWEPRDAFWEQQFAALVLYARATGHCNVPQKYSDNERLGRWLANQRTAKKQGLLTADRVARLEAVGVTWDVNEEAWEQQCAALAKFKKQHGHCNVPQQYADDPSLGRWLSNQRTAKQRRKLPKARVLRLEALGVAWRAR